MTNQFVVDSLYQGVKEIWMNRLNLPRKERKQICLLKIINSFLQIDLLSYTYKIDYHL
jgi:hypothetical protein